MVRIEGGTRGRERLWQHWRQDSWGRVVLLLGAPGTSIGREGMCDRFQARKEQQRTPDRHEAAARRDRRRCRLKILRSSVYHSTSTGLARLTSFRPPFGAAFVIVGCAAAAWAAATSAAYT